MQRYSKQLALLALLLVFASWFSHNLKGDLTLIFQKDLLAHDESSNSVVSANITRKFFPPMMRTNPLVSEPGNWMEGPFWQHIPPLFAYVPYVFYQIDGRVTIEVKRLSYAVMILLTGLFFIAIVYSYSKNLLAALAATIASILWINTPFTHELITGYAFGVSDIVLAWCAVCAFGGILLYLNSEKAARLEYSARRLVVIAVLVALPILAKNLLGAIPAALFFGLLLNDHREFNRKIGSALSGFIGILVLYYLPLLIVSPQTFRQEILVSFFHATNYEGWGRPWHYYVTNYLPERYLFRWTWAFWLGLAASVAVFLSRFRRSATRYTKQNILLSVPLVWFAANLIAVSLINSKIPNFIYQSYLLVLFVICYGILSLFDRFELEQFTSPIVRFGLLGGTIAILLFTARSYVRLDNRLHDQRHVAYAYDSEREKFYQVGEWMQKNGLNEHDLTIVRVSDNDCWLRYDILFLTGAESKTLLEMNFNLPEGELLKQKYQRLFFVLNRSEAVPANLPAYQRTELANYSILQFDFTKMSAEAAQNIIKSFVDAHQKDIQADITRIKADKTSCQWLVPDAILNAP